MSRFLTEPKTAKTTSSHDAPEVRLAIGSSSMQGWRDTMEDAELVQTKLPSKEKMACLAIFDGHGGDAVAKDVSAHITPLLLETDGFKKFDGKDATLLVSALRDCFLTMDDKLRETVGADGRADEIGSTGLVVLITEQYIVSANPIQLAKPIQMSLDHKPDLEAEKNRIVAAGGTVFRGRVSGGVAVSRSFGDFWFKRNEKHRTRSRGTTS
ncbi:hypothetical protein SPRG_17090 [Saprolegnia parasitica CBS 223.65]|uniref:PPM-type phosphatase domain-containing protein n=1 Tax=Saprolegnia parasitica (strain CBS 223.65) TaxID=695850 RepID=A0A067BT63_SAPPC|nr:hypothetical protein SPRG_17090 [Saprolegnia parasitica CBS 223.65]KDO17481.1 hypothetical protein SPRG_17090 [Saprolegnia parasitica CBS 223.65]|eukprot:XP_012211814.1 hypothetical protein SPRG_17090 [Saprolegnia parasitica CBS 223.65]